MSKNLGVRICGNREFEIDFDRIIQNHSHPLKDFLEEDKSFYFQDFLNESQILAWRNRRESNISESKYTAINEETSKQLIQMSEYKRKLRAKKLSTRFMGVSDRHGWLVFRTRSQFTPGKYYTQRIFLKEADDMKYFKEFKARDIIRLFLAGDLKVFCSCPDFKYRYSYLTYNKGFGLQRETRFPKIRNPQLKGAVCKHLICCLTVLGANWSSIAKNMVKTRFFRKKMDDADYIRELDKKEGKRKTKRKG